MKSMSLGWGESHVECMTEVRKLEEILIILPENKKLLRRPGQRWKINIKNILNE
jgi:hypothetical protein